MGDANNDPADALCVLHDAWVDAIGTDELRAAWKRRERAVSLADEILVAGRVPDAALEPSTAVEAALTIIGLDLSLGSVVRDIGGASGTAALADIHVRLTRTGRLNNEADGALLTKRSQTARPGPPDYLRDALVYVTRVSPRVWKKINHVVVDPDHDLPAPEPGAMLKIAAMAMTEDLGDFVIGPADDNTRYRLAPHTPAFTKKRLAEALTDLDASGARIAVLPEGIVDDVVEQRWREVLAANPNDDSELIWIVIGTGPDDADPPHNRARILHRPTGERLRSATGGAITQDKQAPFTLMPGYITAYELADRLPTIELAEHITVGNRLTLIESAAGRYCICICEDLTRLAETAPLFHECGPTHVLAPLFAKEIDEMSWGDKAAEQFGMQIGASVIISNSLAVTRARQAAAHPGDQEIRAHSALAYRYLGDHRKYPKRDLREADGANHPIVFDVHPRPSTPPPSP